MAFLCALSFLTYFDRVCIMRAQGDIQRDLHISEQGMGAVFGIFWLAYALFEIPGGWLGERNGARRTLTRIVLVWSIFTALSGSALGFFSLLACRFLFGAGEAGAYPNMARIQSRWLPADSQGSVSGLLWLVARWGAAFSPMLFGSFQRAADSPSVRSALARIFPPIAHVAGWRMGFWASGLLGVLWIVLFYPWFRDDPAEKRSVNEAELQLIRSGDARRRKRSSSHGPAVWKALFTSRSLWGLSLVYVFGSFGWSFFVSWMPKFLLKVHHIDYAKSEWMTALPMFFGGIASVIGGWLSDRIVNAMGSKRLGRAIFPVAGHVVAAGSIFALRYADTPMKAVVLMSITMAAYDFGLGAKWAAIIDVGGAHAGIAAGFVNMMGNLGGNFLQPIIGAAIFTHFGWGALFGVYAVTYLLSAAMWLFIKPDEEFYREDPDSPRGFPVQPAHP
jgi:MFS family permease